MLENPNGVCFWYVSRLTNMRYGNYRLFSEVEAAGGILIIGMSTVLCLETIR